MRLPKLIAIVIGLSLILSFGSALAADKIAVVNIRQCVTLCEEGKAVFRDLKTEKDKMEAELKTKEGEIEDLRVRLETGTGVLSDTARVAMEGELRRKSRSFRDLFEDSQARIRQLEMEKTQPIVDKLVALIKDYGKANGYTMVFDSMAGVIYFDQNIDITNKIIESYNKKYPVKK
jgi:Skp family chaperone for outer membrane proteins